MIWLVRAERMGAVAFQSSHREALCFINICYIDFYLPWEAASTLPHEFVILAWALKSCHSRTVPARRDPNWNFQPCLRNQFLTAFEWSSDSERVNERRVCARTASEARVRRGWLRDSAQRPCELFNSQRETEERRDTERDLSRRWAGNEGSSKWED